MLVSHAASCVSRLRLGAANELTQPTPSPGVLARTPRLLTAARGVQLKLGDLQQAQAALLLLERHLRRLVLDQDWDQKPPEAGDHHALLHARVQRKTSAWTGCWEHPQACARVAGLHHSLSSPGV